MAAGPRSGADASSAGSSAPRLACLVCSVIHKKCAYDSESGPCQRCARLGKFCEPQTGVVVVRRASSGGVSRGQRPAGAKGGAGRPGKPPLPTPACRAPNPRPHAGPAFPAVVDLARVVGGPRTSSPGPERAGSPSGFDFPQHARIAVPRSPPTGPDVPPEVLFACVQHWWALTAPTLNILHREAFDAAFLSPPSPIYGAHKPAALMSALAAEGVLRVELPGYSPDARFRLSRTFARTARDLLLAGYFGREPGNRPVTDLEAMQACMVLNRYLLGAANGVDAALVIGKAWEIFGARFARELACGGRPGPGDPWGWLRHELVCRAYISMSFSEGSRSLHMDEPLDFDRGVSPLRRIPCHEVFFGMPSAVQAFHLANLRPPLVVDPSPFYADVPDPAACAEVAVRLVAPIADLGASRFAALYLFSLLQRLVVRLRAQARASGLDLIALASQDPMVDTPPQRAFRAGSEAVQACTAAVVDALPPTIGPALAAGDPRPLLAEAINLFSSFEHGNAFLGIFICMNTLPCWLWLRGGEGAVPDAAFFASDPLGTVLECSVLAGKLMEAQMVAGGVPSVHTFAFTAAIKLCALYLAVAGTVASGGDAAARDAAVREAMVSFRYAEEVMATYPIAWRALAPRMHAMLAESGLFLLDRPGVGGTPGVRGQSPPAPVVVGTVKGMLPFASGALTPDPLISMLHSDGEAQEGDMAAGEE